MSSFVPAFYMFPKNFYNSKLTLFRTKSTKDGLIFFLATVMPQCYKSLNIVYILFNVTSMIKCYDLLLKILGDNYYKKKLI